MFNQKLKIVITVLFIYYLMGCGGGDSSSTPGNANVDEVIIEDISVIDADGDIADNVDINGSGEANAEIVTIVEVANEVFQPVPEATVNMSELIASESFSFTNKQQIEVTLDLRDELELTGQTGLRAYVSIYSDYALLSNGTFYANSSSRVLAGELDDGQFNSSFISLKDQTIYLIEVWFYNGDQPLQKEQAIVKNNLTW